MQHLLSQWHKVSCRFLAAPTQPHQPLSTQSCTELSQALSGLSGAFAAVLMYLFQSVFNFFVVSGSGQAAITMPIMAPLADLLGVSRQTSVLAFQLGDAFTNLIVPTSGCLIGSLAIAKIEWSNWIKFMWKFLGILMIGAIITILVAVGLVFKTIKKAYPPVYSEGTLLFLSNLLQPHIAVCWNINSSCLH